MGKCIQGLWIGHRLSLMEQLSIKSFLAHGYDYHLYVYRKIRNIPSGTTIKDANEILPRRAIFKYQQGPGKGSYAGFSNLFRYKLLLDKGGIWIDLDVVCLKPFAFKSQHVFALQNTHDSNVSVNSGFMKVPRGSECMKACYEEAKSKDHMEMMWGQTGPDLLTRYVNKYGLESFILPPEAFCPIDWWEFGKFIDPEYDLGISENTYSVHLWQEMWRRSRKETGIVARLFGKREFDKNILYGPETLYGRLQRMYL